MNEPASRSSLLAGATLVLLVAISAGLPGYAQVSSVGFSPDIAVELAVATVQDDEVARDPLNAVVSVESLPGLPAGVDVVGYSEGPGGSTLLVFNTTVLIEDGNAGGTVVRPVDVALLSEGRYSVLFDGLSRGVPRGSRIDAVSFVPGATSGAPGGLLLSFDTTVTLQDQLYDDADVVHFDLTTEAVSLFFDSELYNLGRGLDVDGVRWLVSGLLLSFDTSGQLGTLSFDDDDVLRLDPNGWSLVYDGAAAYDGWRAADLDALDAGCSPAIADVAITAALKTATAARFEWQFSEFPAGVDVVGGRLELLRNSAGDFREAVESCLANDAVADDLQLRFDSSTEWFLVIPVNDCSGSGSSSSGGEGEAPGRDEEIDEAPERCP